ncbi:hypothetical protein [Desulfuromonas soudanensis]|nr:hypothetical protein [Desulfuromonas soudanensis]
MMESPAQVLAARLIAMQWLPRKDEQVMLLITDEIFREDVLARLKSCGLCLLENPFAENVAIGLDESSTQAVMGRDTNYISNTFGLRQDAMALLVILWALLIIPKRQKQLNASADETDDQMEFFPSAKLVSQGEIDRPAVKLNALVSDFGGKLAKKQRIKLNLGQLKRLGFVSQHNELITEGPLLDLAFDYKHMASRIIEGALADILQDSAHNPEAEDDLDVLEVDNV